LAISKRTGKTISRKCRGWGYNKTKGTYYAEIYVNNIKISLGHFPTAIQAQQARRRAELFYCGKTKKQLYKNK